MRSSSGKVIYVGKSKNLRRRLSDYFLRKGLDSKTESLVSSTSDFEIHITPTESAATTLEEKMIVEFLPRYNLAQRHGHPRYWILEDDSGAWPKFVVKGERPPRRSRRHGPYLTASTAHWLASFTSKMYGLRTCPSTRPTESDFSHCIEHKINNCTAPCVGLISDEEYRKRFYSACLWLSQPSWKMASLIREHMRHLSKIRQFEKAAQCRDVAASLSRRSPASASVDLRMPQELCDLQVSELQTALGMDHPPTQMEAFDVSHLGGTRNVASLVLMKNGRPRRREYRYYRLPVRGPNDPECIRQAVLRRYAKSPLPDLLVIDGGLPQLAAAHAALSELGKSPKTLIALAKERETIFRAFAPPINLPLSSPALHLVQRIRDEAHRFANAYTRRQYSKTLTRTSLTEIKGISEAQSKSLLKKFGSVKRVSEASLASLCEVAGISLSMASRLKRHLSSSV